MFYNDDFVDYMGYRNMVIEGKVQECMDSIRMGETNITIDRGDLNDRELSELQRRLEKRINGGK